MQVMKHLENRIGYIDGLRAIAVLSVVMYHLEIQPFYQGFLGVDIFFVISGYVVSRSLIASMTKENTSPVAYLEHFYRRRFWRLLPALFAMIFVTLLLTYAFVPPSYLSGLILPTAAGAAGGVANISLALGSNSNYFDAATSYDAFLHTWSLGVEEQFYLIVPVLLWLLWKLTRNHKISVAALGLLTLLSFVLSVRWAESNPTISFYLLPSRFWELALGALTHMTSLAFTPRRTLPRPLLVGGAWLGMAMIAVSLFQPVHLAAPYPGAILPVLGTTLVLACWTSGDLSRGAPYHWLSLPPMTYVGRISYRSISGIGRLSSSCAGQSDLRKFGKCSRLSF